VFVWCFCSLSPFFVLSFVPICILFPTPAYDVAVNSFVWTLVVGPERKSRIIRMVLKGDGHSLFECCSSTVLWEDLGNTASEILTGVLELSQPAQQVIFQGIFLYIGRQHDRTSMYLNNTSINMLLLPSESTVFITHTSSYHSTLHIPGVSSVISGPQNKINTQINYIL
jgi:hypothetical protein